MKYRIFSDVHLDFDYGRTRLAGTPEVWEPKPLSSDSATTLIIAGDIWHADKSHFTAEWLNKLSTRFKNIVVVLGNHDYWGSAYWQREPYLLQSQVASNVHVLEKQFVDIEGVRIGGCTLWTDIDKENPLKIINSRQYTNDFRYIQGMRTKHWITEYKECLNWINTYPVDILITHYVPSTKFCHPRYKGGAASCMFNSNTTEEVVKLPEVWLFGHTHDSYTEEYLGTKFICNPRGYRDENKQGFDEVSLYEI